MYVLHYVVYDAVYDMAYLCRTLVNTVVVCGVVLCYVFLPYFSYHTRVLTLSRQGPLYPCCSVLPLIMTQNHFPARNMCREGCGEQQEGEGVGEVHGAGVVGVGTCGYVDVCRCVCTTYAWSIQS